MAEQWASNLLAVERLQSARGTNAYLVGLLCCDESLEEIHMLVRKCPEEVQTEVWSRCKWSSLHPHTKARKWHLTSSLPWTGLVDVIISGKMEAGYAKFGTVLVVAS